MKIYKLTIVTPSFNSSKYISETIESVINQRGNFDIEYILVDGKSTDGTIDIIKKYKNLLDKGLWNIKCANISMKVICEKDKGVYDAINKGFNIATGDIFAYINSDDIYLPGAFLSVIKILNKNKKIEWIKGITSYINENSTIVKAGDLNLYNRNWIKKGIYGRELYFIQQDSTFWRSCLWNTAGPIDSNLKYAGDYYLWVNFAKHTTLFSFKAYVSCFRKRPGQLSEQVKLYKEEMDLIRPEKHPLIGFIFTKFHILTRLINQKNLIS